jgi:prepilin-type N-terminal cleavage/methylation domain-containing protein/prepilin-type processing-associated H-X9-DG protein
MVFSTPSSWFSFHSARRCPSGLTLIELLVSISILVLLVSIAFPALIQARSAARSTACQSNLRQWGLAVHLYADVHHGRLPYRGQGIQPTTRLDALDDWFNALPPLVENLPYIELVRTARQPNAGNWNIWTCPEARAIDELRPGEIDPAIVQATNPTTYFAYGMNMGLSAPLAGHPDRIDRVGPSQTMVFMADGLGPYCSILPAKADYSPVARHNGIVNVAFLDGRVKSFAGEEVGCRIGDPKRDDVRWITPNGVWQGPPK